MPTGKIKKIVPEKGFGFLAGEKGKDIFFHHSSVADRGFDQLSEGQAVEYSLDEQGSAGKGPRASMVRPV